MDVLFEDNHLIVVNKSNNEPVQPDKSGDLSLDERVKEYVKKKYNKPGDVFLGVVHRIDRPVSGVVVFARTSKALARMNKLFKDKKVKKTYYAIIKGRPVKKNDTLVHYIARNTKKNKSSAHDKEVKDSKRSELDYRFVGASDKYSLLEIDLKTGRHHQIRCQLSKMEMPIKGDLKYGFSRSNPDGGICLHSYSIEFMHPVKKEPLVIKAPFPKDVLWKVFEEKCELK